MIADVLRVTATDVALRMIARLQATDGDLMFHQAGVCRDGMFSLAGPTGSRFLPRSRLATDEECAVLAV